MIDDSPPLATANGLYVPQNYARNTAAGSASARPWPVPQRARRARLVRLGPDAFF